MCLRLSCPPLVRGEPLILRLALLARLVHWRRHHRLPLLPLLALPLLLQPRTALVLPRARVIELPLHDCLGKYTDNLPRADLEQGLDLLAVDERRLLDGLGQVQGLEVRTELCPLLEDGIVLPLAGPGGEDLENNRPDPGLVPRPDGRVLQDESDL